MARRHQPYAPDLTTPARAALLSKADLADLLGMSVRTVERLCARRQLPQPMRLGRQLRWRRVAIDDFLRQREAEAARAV
jgi:excisionase family DNA binding protein